MSEILQILGTPSHDYSIVRKEIRTINPFTDSFKNNDDVRLVLQNMDQVVLPCESYLVFSVEYEGESPEGEAYEAGAHLLQNNFMPFMFEEIRYELNGQVIDKIRNPGHTTSLKNFMSMSQSESMRSAHMGWYYDNEGAHPAINQVEVILPLKKLFGFCEDYKKVIINAKHELVLVRSNSDRNAVKLPAANAKYDIQIKKIQWKMPVVEASELNKIALLKVLDKKKDITISFRTWQLFEQPQMPANADHYTWQVKTSLVTEKPRYIIFAMQHNKKEHLDRDASSFDNCNLACVKAYLNSVAYPSEDFRFDFTKNWAQVYEAYSNFQRIYYGREEAAPLLSMNEFAKQGLVFIDCTRQNESLKTGVIDLSLHIETTATKNFGAGTSAYCLIIYDKIIQYNPFNNLVQTIV